MEMDKDMLEGLASILGVTMQQPDRIWWAILQQLYEKIDLNILFIYTHVQARKGHNRTTRPYKKPMKKGYYTCI